jgi:hypothetical protein
MTFDSSGVRSRCVCLAAGCRGVQHPSAPQCHLVPGLLRCLVNHTRRLARRWRRLYELTIQGRYEIVSRYFSFLLFADLIGSERLVDQFVNQFCCLSHDAKASLFGVAVFRG